MSLLNSGSSQVCSAPDVQETLRALVSPASAYADADALTLGIVKATRIDFDLTTLEKFDPAVKAVSCSTNVKFSRDGQSSAGMNLDYTIQPSSEKPGSFVVKSKTDEVAGAYLLNVGVGVAKAREQQQTLAAASTPVASQTETSTNTTAEPTSDPQAQAVSEGPAFDCSKAFGFAENAICSDPELSAEDRKLSAYYKQALAADQTGKVRERGREENARRAACTNRQCIVDWYRQREAELEP